MKHEIEAHLKQALITLQQRGVVPLGFDDAFRVVPSKDSSHGDYTSNIALVLAKPTQKTAQDIAGQLIEALAPHEFIEKIEIAGGGFMNFFIRPAAWGGIVSQVLNEGRHFGEASWKDNPTAWNAFVSKTEIVHVDDAHHEINLAQTRSSDNPIYSIQYAHARMCGVFRQLKKQGIFWDKALGLNNIHRLVETHEGLFLSLMYRYLEVASCAVSSCEPHLVVDYLHTLALQVHDYCNTVPLLCEQEPLQSARLCLLDAVRQVLNNGLHLLGLSAPESV